MMVTMRRRWVSIAVVVLAALFIALIALLALARPAEAPSPSASGSPANATPSPDAGIPFVEPPTPEEAAWFRIGADLGEFPPHLQIGTMERGVTFEAPVRMIQNPVGEIITPQRVVAGVAGGVAVTVEDDGRRSVMRAVVASSGDVHDLVASDDVIVEALLAAGGRQTFFVTADRVTGDLTGAWRLSTEAGAAPERLNSLVGAAPEIRRVAIVPFVTHLMLSPDGTTLGLWRCVQMDCLLRAVGADDGVLVGEVRLQRGGGIPFGITDRLAVLASGCPDGPACLPEVVNLETGEVRPMPVDRWQLFSETVVDSAAGPVMAIQTAGNVAPPGGGGQEGRPAPEITIIGLGDLQVLERHVLPLTSLRIIAGDDYSIGVDLPPGWILIQGSEPGQMAMSVYALNVSDGDIVPLPALGQVFVQG